MDTIVMSRSHVETVVTHNHNFMMILLFLRLSSMFFTQELMVYLS